MALSRRALITLAAGSFAVPAASADTIRRVVCLEWTAAEMALALGVVPVAVGDTQGYRDWVCEPALPATVRDVGSRFEPNREFLLALKPDLIVLTEGYGLSDTDLHRFGATFTIAPFAEGRAPLEHSREQILRLSERMNLAERGRRFVKDVETRFKRHRDSLRDIAKRPVCVASIFEERTARIYGDTGLVGDTLRRLGLVNAWQGSVGPWGFEQVGFEEFARLPAETRLVILDPIPDPVAIRLRANSLWNSLPPVREQRTVHIAPVWPFGGLSAAVRFAGLLVDALKTS